jgi:hypothetical protein
MTEIVRDGYDVIADACADRHEPFVGDTRAAWRNELADGELLGTTMFFSSYPPENSRLVREAGFEPLRDELVTFEEPEGEVTFQWVLARSI